MYITGQRQRLGVASGELTCEVTRNDGLGVHPQLLVRLRRTNLPDPESQLHPQGCVELLHSLRISASVVKKLPAHCTHNQRKWIEHNRLLNGRQRLVMSSRIRKHVSQIEVSQRIVFV